MPHFEKHSLEMVGFTCWSITAVCIKNLPLNAPGPNPVNIEDMLFVMLSKL